MTKNCESCGMPLNEKKGHERGTNADGTVNDKYCAYCFTNGKFTYETDDVKEYQEFCRKMMVEMGLPKWKAWLWSRGYSRLPRWKK